MGSSFLSYLLLLVGDVVINRIHGRSQSIEEVGGLTKERCIPPTWRVWFGAPDGCGTLFSAGTQKDPTIGEVTMTEWRSDSFFN